MPHFLLFVTCGWTAVLGVNPLLGAQATAATKPAPPSLDPNAGDEIAARNAVFESLEWRRTRMAFDDWLSIQTLYNDRQVADVKRRLQKKIAATSARDLPLLREQMQAKLDVLLSPEASDVRRWLSHFASPSVVLTPEELKEFDIVNMTAPQMRAALERIDSRRMSRAAKSDAFSSLRQQQVTRTVDNSRARRQSQQQSRATAQANRQANASQQSHLAPPRQPPRRRPRPQIWLGPGGAGVVLPMGP